MQDFFPKLDEKKLENAIYVIATPIGNLADITFRAVETLAKSDFIICEDSRVSNNLLKNYQITEKKFIVYNDHADVRVREKILNLLISGNSMALISDAGTPLISDPGYKLINYLRQNNQKIIPIPGASSVTSAMSVSGLACDNFLFLGFLPHTANAKEKLLRQLPRNYTFVVFESAMRVADSLEIISKILPGRRVCVARELTKIYEEIITDDIDNLIKFFQNNSGKLRGEFVIIVEKADKNDKGFGEDELIGDIARGLEDGDSVKDISQNLAEIYGVNRKDVYKLALEMSRK
jgi:16S rRNA (cytidine1402-2'-O)-methyltransferase